MTTIRVKEQSPWAIVLIFFLMIGISSYGDSQREVLISEEDLKSLPNWDRANVKKDIKSLTSKPQFKPSSELALYHYEEGAIEFTYPSHLLLTDHRWHEGIDPLSTIGFPVISLQSQRPEGHTRGGICSRDCIRFDAEPSAYVPRQQRETPAQNWFHYQDETGSQPFKMNGLEVLRYYAIHPVRDWVGYVQIGWSLEDHTFLKDPFIYRWMQMTYYERVKSLPREPNLLTGKKVKELFDQEKYKAFQSIVSSFKFLPIDTTKWRTYSNKELGISFSYPAYWGYITEQRYGTSLVETIVTQKGTEKIKATLKYDMDVSKSENLSPEAREAMADELYFAFLNPLLPRSGFAQIGFEVHSPKTVTRHIHDYSQTVASRSLFQYTGQSLKNACENQGYLNTLLYDVRLTQCDLRSLPNGTGVVIFKGSFSQAYEGSGPSDREIDWHDRYKFSDYELALILPEERKFTSFVAAILPTKSHRWPGITMYVMGTRSEMEEREALLNQILLSLSYTSGPPALR